jgi:hypothetical protein
MASRYPYSLYGRERPTRPSLFRSQIRPNQLFGTDGIHFAMKLD